MSKEERKELTPSQAAHRRGVLAEARREGLPPDYLQQRIVDTVHAEARLDEIGRQLQVENNSTPLERACLGVEVIWLEFRLEKITQAQRDSNLQKFLNEFEEKQPQIYSKLMSEGEGGMTLIAQIRDRVLSTVRIGGFRTKRGR